MNTEERRAQLEGWIAQTRRTQKKLVFVAAGVVVVALLLFSWRTDVAVFALLAGLLFAMCAFWITSSHITDWKQRLADLDRPPQVVGRRA